MQADATPYVGEMIQTLAFQLCQAQAERDAAMRERDEAIRNRDNAAGAVERLTKQIAEMALTHGTDDGHGDRSRDITAIIPPIV